MTAEYDEANSWAALIGDGTGRQRMRRSLPSAKAGDNQMIVVMRVHQNSASTANISNSSLSWSAASFLGLKFDSIYPTTSQANASDYDNFFGPAIGDIGSAPYDEFWSNYDATHGVRTIGRPITSSPRSYLYNANGSTLDTSISPTDSADTPFTISLDDSDTIVWRFYTSLVDDSVLFDCWRNTDSIDLSSFDISSDLNPDNPTAAIPVSGSHQRTGSIHGDVTGTNWRPSSGAMAFPTHFMACHSSPSTDMKILIPYLDVQYSTIS